ncbi:hypothetical protein RMSM_06682 [Rhodopirellula maiorica SM1]|uniref:Uncharacterized protein n=1 Tax=Rhodopirellula maiorica SM1 TaxID=1265738 RepID=M5RR13_9BACT|nr:hypothetical protein RMSM_06682 [Rhodopirellula maiorica SM1]
MTRHCVAIQSVKLDSSLKRSTSRWMSCYNHDAQNPAAKWLT